MFRHMRHHGTLRRTAGLPSLNRGSVSGQRTSALGWRQVAFQDRSPWIRSRMSSSFSCPEAEHEPGPAYRDGSLARLEAVLFLLKEPSNGRKLAQLCQIRDGHEVRRLVRRLNTCYQHAGTAFRVEEVAGGYQLLTRPAFSPWIQRIRGTAEGIRVSGAAMEALTIVAYRQPVTRAEVEAIRGGQSGEILRQLMERDLIRLAGRGDELGRPFLYATTKKFLRLFGLRTLSDLPSTELTRPDEEHAA